MKNVKNSFLIDNRPQSFSSWIIRANFSNDIEHAYHDESFFVIEPRNSKRKTSRPHLLKGRNRNGHGTLCSFTAVCNATRECNSVYLDKAIKRETIGERTWGITRPYFHRPLMNRACISVSERRTRPRERNPGVLGDGGMLTARVSWSICAWIARSNGKSGPPQTT